MSSLQACLRIRAVLSYVGMTVSEGVHLEGLGPGLLAQSYAAGKVVERVL